MWFCTRCCVVEWSAGRWDGRQLLSDVLADLLALTCTRVAFCSCLTHSPLSTRVLCCTLSRRGHSDDWPLIRSSAELDREHRSGSTKPAMRQSYGRRSFETAAQHMTPFARRSDIQSIQLRVLASPSSSWTRPSRHLDKP